MLAQKTVEKFIDELASDSPAPGGGSVAALCGSLGAALAAMVSRLTIGREKYRDAWESMEAAKDKALALSRDLLELMEKDTQAFNLYMAARKLPKETDAEKAARKKAMDEASVETAKVPLCTMELCLAMAEVAAVAARHGNPNAITDAGTAAMLARAGAKAAQYNVLVNLPGISDAVFSEHCRAETNRIMAEVETLARSVDAHVSQALA